MIRFYDQPEVAPTTAFLLGQLSAQAEQEREARLAALIAGNTKRAA